MKLAVVTASISRQAGGLFWSVRALADGVRRTGIFVEVHAVEDPWTLTDRAQWNGLDLNIYRRLGPAAFSFAPGMVDGLVASDCDLLHIHGLWMYPSVVAQRWTRKTGRPYIVSPRGMLDSWALRNSRWKKRMAWSLYEQGHLRKAACIHALCDSEARSIRAMGLKNPVCVIPNGVTLPYGESGGQKSWGGQVPPGARVLLSLGRLHPKKNLEALVDAFGLGKSRSLIGPEWHLVIAGWDQGGHEAVLKASVHRRGLDNCVHFPGPLFLEEKDRAFRHSAAFALPSHSEGLPMAILEAWSYGLPVLMTDGCNLPEGFLHGAAVRLPEDVEHMSRTLSEVLGRNPDELFETGRRGRALVEQRFAWPDISAEMAKVYGWILGGGPRPDSVVLD